MKWQNDIAFTKGTTWHTQFRNKHKITNRTVTNFTCFFFSSFFQFHVNPFKYPEMEVKAILYMQNRWIINQPKQKHNDKHNDGVTIQ